MGVNRVGVIGDVHCEHDALGAALAHLAQLGVERVLCVGDIPDGSGDVNRCCAMLEDADALCVMGNHERWLFSEHMRDAAGATSLAQLTDHSARFLRELPKTREIDTPGGLLPLCHGLGENDMAKLQPDDQGYALENNDALNQLLALGRHAFVISGHTHKRMVRRVGTLTVINAGTLHHDFNPCFALVDFENEAVQFFDVVDAVVREAEHRALAEWTELF